MKPIKQIAAPVACEQAFTRVLVAGEDVGLRSQIRNAFGPEARVEVVAEASNLDQLLGANDSLLPDLVVLCANAHVDEQASLVRSLARRRHGAHVLMLCRSSGADDPTIAAAVQAAAECLRALAGGVPSAAPQSPSVRPTSVAEKVTADVLTEREREVLRALANGLSSKEIARDMSISVRTVECHRAQIMSKSGLHSVAELTKFAIREGLTVT